jgi:hypothetical protein
VASSKGGNISQIVFQPNETYLTPVSGDTVNATNSSPANGDFTSLSVNYKMPAIGGPVGDPIKIELSSTGVQHDFDTASVTAIPLPLSVYAGLGLLGSIVAFRMTRKASQSVFI